MKVIYWLGLGIASLQAFINPCFAQSSNIVPDDSLGAESSQIDENFLGLPLEVITDGAQRGINLFHSFREFNVSEGREAYFFSPNAEVQNILTRVTGRNPSEILGTLGTFGNSQPNLYLINPNGIVFGENASLDVGGSFVATTANGINLGETGFFSATEPTTSNLLSVNPSALFFNAVNSQAGIVNRSRATSTVSGFALNGDANRPINGLQVLDGKSLLLVGGDVSLDGGRLSALGGRVELGGLAAPGNVNLLFEGDNFKLGFPENVTRADVSLTNQAFVFVEADGGGDIAINARNLEILQGSQLSAGIGQGLGTLDTVAGDIVLNATREIKVAGAETIVGNIVSFDSQGNGGNITVDSGSFLLGDGAQLQASTYGIGNSGNVQVTVTDAVSLIDGNIFSTVEVGGNGQGGSININAATLSLTDGAQLQTIIREASESDTQAPGKGNAGNVNVEVSGLVDIAGERNGNFSAIYSSVGAGTKGNAGNITIDSGSLLLRDGAELVTSTYGIGNAGNVKVTSTDAVSIADNAYILSTVGAGGEGQGGNIDINAARLSLTDGAQLETSTYGIGNAGNVKVKATDAVSLVGANILSTVEAGGEGQGGNIDINAATLTLRDGAQMQTIIREASDTQPAGKGDAGNINIKVTGAVDIAGERDTFPSGLFSELQTGTQGHGGNITLDAGSFNLEEGAQLGASTYGNGNAGNVTVTAKDAIFMTGGQTSILSAVEAGGVGKGGNININAATLTLRDGAQLITITREASDTQPAGEGDAGNINVKVTGAVDISGERDTFPSGLFSELQTGTQGHGGNITLDAGSFNLEEGAQLGASTYGNGNAGNVTVTAKDAIFMTDGQTSILSAVEAGGVGKGGNININAATLTLRDGAQLITITREASDTQPAGEGDAGNINVKVTGAVDISGERDTFPSGLFSEVQIGTQGNGGNIIVDAGSFNLAQGAVLSASTLGNGNAGTIEVHAAEFFTVSDLTGNFSTGLFVNSQSTGSAKDIIVNSPKITLDGGKLNANSASGNGGNINLTSDLLLMRRGAQISTNAGTAQKGGDGGNININSKFIVALPQENSDITANAFSGAGGNVNILSQGIFGIEPRAQQTDKSDITASSDLGVPGNLNLTDPDDSSIRNNLDDLPDNQIDTNALIANSCIARGTKRQENSFKITGSGGLRNSPGDGFISEYSTGDVRNVEPVSSTWKKGDRIIEPQGLYQLPDGRLLLSRAC